MSTQQVMFIHGGSSYSNYEAFLNYLRTVEIEDISSSEPKKKWPSTLPEVLEEQCSVYMPSMPNKQNAQYPEWKIWFERYFEHITHDVILIGYSLGGYFLAKYLVENTPPVPIKALFLVAAPFENDTDDSKEDGGNFAFDTSKVGELSKKVESIVLFHSTDDFVVPYSHALKYHEALPEAELVTCQGQNHFLVPELPQLVQRIQNML